MPVLLGRFLGVSFAALTVLASSARADETAPQAWCAPELETLPGDVCHAELSPGSSGRRTLVIFLHGVIQPDTTWQWGQQRGIVRSAKRLGFSVIMPRGRRGIGPPGMTDWITWPTSTKAQRSVEDDLLEEWKRARELVETRSGHAFDEVFVVGFSNGAYYASSLALRGRMDVDGYAVFAGGGASYLRREAASTRRRAPIFVAICAKDATARDARPLSDMLGTLRWPHRSESRPVGHAIADVQLDHAIAFLRNSSAPKPTPPRRQ